MRRDDDLRESYGMLDAMLAGVGLMFTRQNYRVTCLYCLRRWYFDNVRYVDDLTTVAVAHGWKWLRGREVCPECARTRSRRRRCGQRRPGRARAIMGRA